MNLATELLVWSNEYKRRLVNLPPGSVRTSAELVLIALDKKILESLNQS